MRTINVNAGNLLSIPTMLTGLPEDKQPCWYAEVEKADSKKDYKWKVGCKFDGKTEEFSFKFSKVGNVNDTNFWGRVTGIDFAIKLVDLFKNGGAKSVKEWMKSGCP